MFLTTILLKIIKRSDLAYRFTRNLIVSKLGTVPSSKNLNGLYNKLSWNQKRRFFRLYARVFEQTDIKIPDGSWELKFMDKRIRLPLRNEFSLLDWDLIVSLLGHDPEIKITYQHLIASGKVKVFFDIGANYGTHSLLFLVNKIRTVSFEPNINLEKEFSLYCRLNNVKGEMENVAIGERQGFADLYFRENETWNASVIKNEKNSPDDALSKKIKVPLITIDEYVSQKSVYPDLIKIDTEGNELNVLMGARNVIKEKQPLIIFETNHRHERTLLWNFFTETGYTIQRLPYNPVNQLQPVTKDYFLKCGANNYIALPAQT